MSLFCKKYSVSYLHSMQKSILPFSAIKATSDRLFSFFLSALYINDCILSISDHQGSSRYSTFHFLHILHPYELPIFLAHIPSTVIIHRPVFQNVLHVCAENPNRKSPSDSTPLGFSNQFQTYHAEYSFLSASAYGKIPYIRLHLFLRLFLPLSQNE